MSGHLTRDALSLGRLVLATILVMVVGLTVTARLCSAQASGRIQELSGAIFPGEFYYYSVPDLEAGQTLYVYLDDASGNLDPVAGIVAGGQNVEALEREYQNALAAAIAEGVDPVVAARQVQSRYFLGADDDSGPGLAAAFPYEVPEDGDYGLIVAGTLASLGSSTFGDYRLLIGVDAPGVLEGTGRPTGDVIATLDRAATPLGEKIEESSGGITVETYNEGD